MPQKKRTRYYKPKVENKANNNLSGKISKEIKLTKRKHLIESLVCDNF